MIQAKKGPEEQKIGNCSQHGPITRAHGTDLSLKLGLTGFMSVSFSQGSPIEGGWGGGWHGGGGVGAALNIIAEIMSGHRLITSWTDSDECQDVHPLHFA